MKSKNNNEKHLVSAKFVIFDKNSGKFLLEGERKKEKIKKSKFIKLYVSKDNNSLDDLVKVFKKKIGLDDNVNVELIGVLDTVDFKVSKNKDEITIYVLVLLSANNLNNVDNDIKDKLIWVESDELSDDNDEIVNILKEAEKKMSLAESQNNTLRLLAEFDNYKKRAIKERDDFAKYAAERIINEFLPVLDNFNSATEHIPEDQADSPWLTGIMYIKKQMEKVLEDEGVVEIVVNPGDEFDIEVMESVISDNKDKDVNKDDKKQIVSKIVKKGYRIKDKILRPVRVELE